MRKVCKTAGVFLAASVFLAATALWSMASDNPFESGGLDSYLGQWVNTQEESVLVLLPGGKNQLKGAISRKSEALTLRVSLFQGILSGEMVQGTESFPLKITRKGNSLTVEAGAWSVDLVPAGSASFEGQFKKDDFEIQLNRGADNEYNGGIRMNGKVYVLDAKARQGALWGNFSQKGERWPFFLYHEVGGGLSFHTGQFVLDNIRSKAEADKAEAAQLAEEQVMFDKIQKNDLPAAIRYLQAFPHGHLADKVRKIEFHVKVKQKKIVSRKGDTPYWVRWEYTRDNLGQVVHRHRTIDDGRSQTRDITYVAYDNIDTIKDSDGYSVQYTYDDQGRCVQWESSAGQTCDLTYDDNGNLIKSVQNSRKSKITIRYDAQGRRIYRGNEGGGRDTFYWYTYGFNGEVATERFKSVDHDFHKILVSNSTYSYDKQGRETQWVERYADGGTRSAIFTYPTENKKEKLSRDSEGKTERTTYEYNDYGDLILMHSTSENGYWSEDRYEYEYQPLILEGVL